MSNRPSHGRGSPWFDGPGARPTLGEPGPSTGAAKASPHHDDQTLGGNSRGVGGGPFTPHDSRIGNIPRAVQLPQSGPAPQPPVKRVGGKANVSSACGPCKRAHLACDPGRPCKRCIGVGKEDQCEDVPHKKRGRPKVNRTPAVEPYARSRPAPPSMDGRSQPTYDSPYGTTATSPHQMGLPAPRSASPPRPPLMGQLAPYDMAAASSYHGLPPGLVSANSSGLVSAPGPDDRQAFNVFCSTELKILRVSNNYHNHLGFHRDEFCNLSLLNWILSNERHLIERDRSDLLSRPHFANHHVQTSRETQAAIRETSDRDLISPANGMEEPYPNTNVHMRHYDGSYSLFNVRQHLGGGLGGSAWPETFGNIYLVISCLPISQEPPQDQYGRRHHQGPPSVVSQSSAHLPSFSSLTAGVDPPVAPSSPYNTYHRPPSASAPSPYFSRPTTSSSSAAYPPSPVGPDPRAPSPAGQAPFSHAPTRYHSYPPVHPPQGYYPPQSPHFDRRVDVHPDEWRRQSLPSSGGPGSGPPHPDYRRGWDRQ